MIFIPKDKFFRFSKKKLILMRFLSYFLLTVFTSMLFSCSITKRIGENEQLLTKNKIEFDKDFKVKNEATLKTELATLYRQTANEKWLFFYKLPAHLYLEIEDYKKKNFPKEYFTDDDFDVKTLPETSLETALRNLAERRIAEKPTIFNEGLMEISSKQMENYMHNRGYFNAKVTASINNPLEKSKVDDLYFNPKRNQEVISKTAEVTYIINSKNLYRIDSVEFKSKDLPIQKILDSIAEQTFLKKGAPVDGILYDKEKNRITNTLRNKGYTFFTSNYIAPLSGDSSDFKTNIVFEVLPFNSVENHKKYRIGEIYIYPNYNPILKDSVKQDTIIDDFHFIGERDKDFWIKPNRLSENIFIKRGELYQQKNLNKTNRKLTDLGAFRFVNFRQEIDENDPEKINIFIQITPRKKWEIGYDLEPNFTQRNYTNSLLNLFGISGNIYLGNKNLLRGAEQLSINFFPGFEFNLGENLGLNVIDIRFQANVDIPRFTDYLGIYKGLNRFSLMGDKTYYSLKDLAKTRANLGYNFLSIDRFYTYHLFDAGWGFDYRNRRNRFIFNNLAIDVLRPINIEPAFESILSDNQFLSNSFGDQLFTGFLLRDFSYIWTKKPNVFGESYFTRFFTEISGGEVLGINQLYNALGNNNDTLRLGPTFEFSQFAKFEIDARYTRKFNSKISAASRINIGVALPFGYSKEVPYVKQFYVGGPQSIRAWGARGLGPGSYQDPITQNTNNRLLFYQTGDFKFELNGELRFFLTQFFARLEGAVFLDIGNVWTLNEDPNNGRPGSVLQWKPKIVNGVEVGDNFFKEMAVGTGFGFRFDFEYFLLRFDLGYPLKNPYKTLLPDGTSTYLATPTLNDLSTSNLNYNLGMNYPF